MAGFFGNWGSTPAGATSFLSPFEGGQANPVAAMSSWGQGITAPSLFAPSALGTVDVAPRIGGAGGLGGGMGGLGGGTFMDKAALGLTGVQTLGSLWGAFQAAKLAKKQFNYTKQVTDMNIENQLKTYNTQLTDRANNRAIVEGKSAEQTAAYIDANKLSRYGTRG